MLRRDATIVNRLGLHARASSRLTQTAGRYASDVWLTKNDRRVNAKSIMGVMLLAAGQGAVITIETDGKDEEEAMNALLEIIQQGFGEEM